MNKLSSDIIFGDPFLRKIRAVLDFSERTIEIWNLTKESMIFPLSDNETRIRLSALIPQPGELGELKTFQQITFPPQTMTAVEVMLKGRPIKDADGYVRGISRKNSQLHVIPGLVHLEKDEIRQGYKCCIEVINLGTTTCTVEKGSTIAKHLYVTEQDAENTIVKTLAKEHIGESFERAATNLQQKKVELSGKIHLNFSVKNDTQEDCHSTAYEMASQMRKQSSKQFSDSMAFCAICLLTNTLSDAHPNLEPTEDVKMIPTEYAKFAEKTGLTKSELSLDESLQLCKLFERYKEI